MPRLRLRHLLLAVNLTALWLPLLGLEALRLYDSALVRQTESELNAQAAFVAAAYRGALARLAPAAAGDPGYGLPLDPRWAQSKDDHGRWRPRPARLDLAVDAVQPPPPETGPPDQPPDPQAWAVGEELQALLPDVQAVTLAGIAVTDAQGTVVATTGTSRGRSMGAFAEVRRALTGESLSLLRQRIPDGPAPAIDSISRGTPLRVFVAVPIVQGQRVLGAALLWRTPVALSQVLYGKRRPLLLAAILVVGTLVALSVLTSLTLARPLRALVAQARRATAGERGAVTPLARPVIREVAEVSESVAAMARHLEQRADYIRSFAAQMSHEFKTPLAGIRGAVELLRDHGETMSPAERERFLDHLDQDAARLDRLVRRVLELARADVLQVSPEERVAVAPLLRRLAARYQPAGLTVTLAEPLPTVTVAMSEDSLQSILANLLDNARDHGAARATLTLGSGEPTGQAWLEVGDDGPGISPANARRVFEPFFTTARGRGGTGLGLTLVRSLLAAHGGRIRLLEGTGGVRLRLELPLAPAPGPG